MTKPDTSNTRQLVDPLTAYPRPPSPLSPINNAAWQEPRETIEEIATDE